MYPTDLTEIENPVVRKRIATERKIVLAIIDKALAEGFELSVDDGEETYPWTTDRKTVIDAIMNTDEDWLRLRKGDLHGTIFLVYGNSGWDVICDYHTSLEEFLKPINAMCERLEG